MAELRKMPANDLRSEIVQKRADLSKQRLALKLQKEKNSGAYRTGKRTLARMLTALREKEQTAAGTGGTTKDRVKQRVSSSRQGT